MISLALDEVHATATLGGFATAALATVVPSSAGETGAAPPLCSTGSPVIAFAAA
jgi:hypothetical protein